MISPTNGKPREKKLSPTQIKAYLHCKRRWGFEYLDGKRSAPSKYAQFGINGHKQLEQWFKEGSPPSQQTPEGLVALSGLHHWPAPQNVSMIEFAIETTTATSTYYGYQDIGFQDPETGLWVVGDHKFTGSFEYALTEEDLKTDVQSNIYARAAMDRHRVEKVELRWVYYRRTGNAKSKRVSLVLIRDEVEKVFAEKIDPAAEEIHQVLEAGGVSGKDMPANPRACDDYGGCPHLGYCEVSGVERMRVAMSDLTLKEKLQDKIKANAGINPPESSIPVVAAPPAPAGAGPLDKFRKAVAPTLPPGRTPLALVPQPAPATVAAPAAPVSALDKLRQRQAAVASEPAPLAAPAPATPAIAPTQPAAPASGGSALDRIRARQATPAEDPAPAPAPAPTPTPAPSGGSALEKLRAKQAENSTSISAPEPTGNALLDRIRAKQELVPLSSLGTVAPDASVAQAIGDALQQYPEGVAQGVGNPQRVFTLLINCRMVRPNAPFVLAADIVEEANKLVCDELGVSHYSLVDYKARGAITTATRSVLTQRLASGELAPGDTIMLFTSDRTESDCADAFVEFADRIIRS